MDIRFDFTTTATRDRILETLLEYMTYEQRERFDEVMSGAVVPEHHHHSLADIEETIDSLHVAANVKEDMRGVYAILAQAEATVHGCAVEQTHFHEVGNASGIRNALAICVAVSLLEPERIYATPVQPGSGKIECAHGLLDLPAPATAAILAQDIPLCETRLEGERCTPTSAALIKHFVQVFEVG